MHPRAEVVKRLVHNLRKNGEKEGKISEKRQKPAKKKLPYLFIEADEDHVPLKEKRGNHHTKRKKKKSRILAKLVYVHEEKETSGSGRAKLKNPHYFARRYEDTEELFLEVLEYLEENYDLQSVAAIFLCGDGAPWMKKGLEIIPQSIFILPRFHLAQRIQGACPEPHKRGELWKAIEEGSWENVEAFFSQVLSRKEGSQERRKLKDLCTYLSCNWEGIQNARHYRELELRISAEAHGSLSFQLDSPIVPWAGGERE